MTGRSRTLLLAAAFAIISAASGACAYLSDRGNDALDMFDVGVTVSPKPHFGVYAGFQSILGIGYADIDGKLLGIGDRKVGALDMRYKAAGSLLEAKEAWAFADDYDKADEDSPQRRGVGLGLIYGPYPKTVMGALNCPKLIHLGFIGFNLNCKIGQIADFILGWTTLDIASDDEPLRSQ